MNELFKKKEFLFVLILGYILAVTFMVLFLNKPKQEVIDVKENDVAISRAKVVYKQAVADAVNLSSGPCLSNDLLPGWVLDIVHTPREEIDNIEGNQCQAYIEGRAKHIIELDTGGNVVRVK